MTKVPVWVVFGLSIFLSGCYGSIGFGGAGPQTMRPSYSGPYQVRPRVWNCHSNGAPANYYTGLHCGVGRGPYPANGYYTNGNYNANYYR